MTFWNLLWPTSQNVKVENLNEDFYRLSRKDNEAKRRFFFSSPAACKSSSCQEVKLFSCHKMMTLPQRLFIFFSTQRVEREVRLRPLSASDRVRGCCFIPVCTFCPSPLPRVCRSPALVARGRSLVWRARGRPYEHQPLRVQLHSADKRTKEAAVPSFVFQNCSRLCPHGLSSLQAR